MSDQDQDKPTPEPAEAEATAAEESSPETTEASSQGEDASGAAGGESSGSQPETGESSAAPAAETPEPEPSAAAETAPEEPAAPADAAEKPAAKEPAAAPAPPAEAAPKPEKLPWEVDPSPPEWQDEDDHELVRALREALPAAIESARSFAGDLTLVVKRDQMVDVGRALKDDHGYNYMVDVAGADYPDREERFDVVYHVYNIATDQRVRFKTTVGETGSTPSLCDVWVGVNWPEREAYDMYGIRFEGHPDLTRILLWEGFQGYPLRKEFPVEGIDTGAAIYPEYYDEQQGPIGGDGTGWKVPKPPEPEAATPADDAEAADGDAAPAEDPA